MFSIPIGSILGVRIRVHLLFLLLIALLVFTESPLRFDAAGRVLFLGILWGSVLLHELGHSLMARRLHVQVLDITFWPLGGMARFVDFPSDPKVELPIALAGPAVNFALALLLVPFAATEGWGRLAWTVNLALGLFNLVPAFPMDGGRILRALLAFKLGFLQATEIAVRLGRWIALLLVAAAFYLPPALMFLVVAAFIWLSGTQELWSVRLRHATRTGNPFAFWKSFGFGRKRAETPPPPPENPDRTKKDLEGFRGSLREFFDGRRDPGGS